MTWLADLFASGRLTFLWPWLGLLLPLPWILRAAVPPASRRDEATLRVPFGDALRALVGDRRAGGATSWWRAVCAAIGWTLLVAAAMRPQLLAEQQSAPVTGRNLMLAVDLSGSMEAKDFELAGRTVDRLTATKAVAGDFIDRRAGDRMGLILFGERAYMQTPLTFDRETLKTLLFEAVIGLAGEKTAIGDAIALAVKHVREADAPRQEQVLVLLTDGANTAGSIPPLKAAELAAQVGLRIYTIGIGADRVMIDSLFGRRPVNPSADLDEATLTEIANQTGGAYFRARDTVALAEIYGQLDQLEPAADEEEGFRPRDDVFFWPAGLAALVLCLPGFAGLLPGAHAGRVAT